MFYQRIQYSVVVFLFFTGQALAQKGDPTLIKITKGELAQAVKTTPLSYPAHLQLIARAYYSGLPQSRLLYEKYTGLAKEKENDPKVTLLAAVATLKYYEIADEKRRSSWQSDYRPILQEAGILFRRAMFLDPNSAQANKHYGYFMYRYGYSYEHHAESQQGKQIGLTALSRSALLDPKDARVHGILGDIYANPYQKTYDPKKAEAELLKAIALDPTYSYPHNRLIGLYYELKKPAKVREQIAAYQALAPVSKNNSFIKTMLEECVKMEKVQATGKTKP